MSNRELSQRTSQSLAEIRDVSGQSSNCEMNPTLGNNGTSQSDSLTPTGSIVSEGERNSQLTNESPRTKSKRIRMLTKHLSSSSLNRRKTKPVHCKGNDQ